MLEELYLTIMKHKRMTGLSQARIAMQAGIIETRMCNILKGKVSIMDAEKKSLSKVLGVDQAELFPLEEAERSSPRKRRAA